MNFSPQLIALGEYLAGEFDNREHLRLWQRPVNLFTEDSITLFAEQASVIKTLVENPRVKALCAVLPTLGKG